MQTAKATATPAPSSPWCTLYDCPFVSGQTVTGTGFVGSVACRLINVVPSPYAEISAVFFVVMSAVTCFGQYRSRQNYIAEEKLVTDITAQGTEMKNRTREAGAIADALTSNDKSWKERAEDLQQEKGVLEKARDALQHVCDILRQENVQLRANASLAAKGAQEDGAQVSRLASETSSLEKDLKKEAASQDQLTRAISGAVSDHKEQGMLQQGIQKVADLVNALRPSAEASNAGKDAEATADSLNALTMKAQHEADDLV